MKSALAIAILAALSSALAVDGAIAEETPLKELLKKLPKDLRRNGTRVDRDIEANAADYDQLAREECKAGAMAFDEYCHDTAGGKRFGDWRNVRDPDGEDHECAYSEEPS